MVKLKLLEFFILIILSFTIPSIKLGSKLFKKKKKSRVLNFTFRLSNKAEEFFIITLRWNTCLHYVTLVKYYSILDVINREF